MKRKMIMAEYLVFDWGGTALKYALMNEQAEILEKGDVPSPSRDASKEEFMDVIDGIVNPYLNRIKGIAISSPGIIDPVSGTINVVAVFPYLNGCCIAKEFAQRYHVPVSLENDGKSAALAELWKGNLAGCTDGAVMLIGTGIGGGLIIDGKLHRGKDFLAGEFSMVCTDIYHADQKESYWSDLGYRGLFRRLSLITGEEVSEMNGYTFFERVENKDSAALEALKQYTDQLAVMCMSLNMLLNLDAICIGGGISRQPALMDSLYQSVSEIPQINPDMREGLKLPLPVVKPCAFLSDANLIGALYHHLHEN